VIIFGVNEGAHDASLSVVRDGQILFAGHAERQSKVKNDWFINPLLLNEALAYGTPDKIAYYEKPVLKTTRLLLRNGLGQKRLKYTLTGLENVPTQTFKHHHSHAAAGYYTSGLSEAVVVVLDAIGEWETTSIWVGSGDTLKRVYSKRYPFSFGLFYTAFTDLLGLKPNEEEYIMMGMAGYGNKHRYKEKVNSYFPSITSQKYNFHKGVLDWDEPLDEQSKFDIAAAVQAVYEDRLIEFMSYAKTLTGKSNLVFMGGCALNCSANTLLRNLFDSIWIMPSPGDSGSSLGAAAALYGKHLNWEGPYLGTNIEGEYPVQAALEELKSNQIVAVASGRAEYGPRALGNRSILADPRTADIKDKVNLIKKRELFRPFAPVVLEEFANEWFDIAQPSPYMQFAVRCKRPDDIPSVVHIDGTSRVQTVNAHQHPGLYSLLTQWHEYSGVPILLNTSLNIKGQPLLNDMADVATWQITYPSTKIVY